MVAENWKIVIALVVILATSSFSVQGEATQEIEVSVELIERQTNGDVQIWVNVQNHRKEPVFLAVIDITGKPVINPTSKSLIFHFFTVEQWQPRKGWIPVGPRRDLPPPAVVKVKPGNSVKGLMTIGELLPVFRGDDRIPIQGKHRIKLWYFNSRDEWDNYRADLIKGRIPRGKCPMAISQPFDIPRPGRSH